jgi:tetratricopeptide (TPR) repeat protein
MPEKSVSTGSNVAAEPPPAPRTLPWVVRYLTREARAKPPTFIEVEYTHELQRVDALKMLAAELNPHGIPVSKIQLDAPFYIGDGAPVHQLIEMLERQPDGAVIFVSGFETVLPPPGLNRNRVLAQFNWYRETIVERPLHQVWWVTPGVAASMSRAIPDLDSWFLHRLSLSADEEHARGEINAIGWQTNPERKRELLNRADELCVRANILRDQGRYAEAAPLLREALRLREAILGEEDQKTLAAIHSLAQILRGQCDLYAAEVLLRRVLNVSERLLGEEHPDVARDLTNLALLLKDTNRHAEAEPLFRRALAIDEKSLGPDHPNVARDLNNLAWLLKDTNRHAEAEPLFRQVLRILAEFDQRTGHEHPHFRTAINNYAGLLTATGLRQDAIAARVRSAIEGESARGQAKKRTKSSTK